MATPQTKETYCGRVIDEEEWLTTSKEANCSACAQAGAPMPDCSCEWCADEFGGVRGPRCLSGGNPRGEDLVRSTG